MPTRRRSGGRDCNRATGSGFGFGRQAGKSPRHLFGDRQHELRLTFANGGGGPELRRADANRPQHRAVSSGEDRRTEANRALHRLAYIDGITSAPAQLKALSQHMPVRIGARRNRLQAGSSKVLLQLEWIEMRRNHQTLRGGVQVALLAKIDDDAHSMGALDGIDKEDRTGAVNAKVDALTGFLLQLPQKGVTDLHRPVAPCDASRKLNGLKSKRELRVGVADDVAQTNPRKQ